MCHPKILFRKKKHFPALSNVRKDGNIYQIRSAQLTVEPGDAGARMLTDVEATFRVRHDADCLTDSGFATFFELENKSGHHHQSFQKHPFLPRETRIGRLPPY